VTGQPVHKWGPPYDRGAILGRVRAVETGGTTGYERKLEAELQAAREREQRLRERLADTETEKIERGTEILRLQEREKALREALKEAGLPETASVQDLIRHHRSNAALAAGFDRIAAQRPEEAGGRITHGRHCTCSACAAQDWGEPGLAPCGMHGPSCPAEYQPWGAAGTYRRTEKADG